MKKQSRKAKKQRFSRFANLFKDKCPKCGHILKKSGISKKNKKGNIIPIKKCPNPDCDYKE